MLILKQNREYSPTCSSLECGKRGGGGAGQEMVGDQLVQKISSWL